MMVDGPDALTIDVASPDDARALNQLLKECGLPYEDLTPRHLEQIWVGRAGPRIVAAVGLEQFGRFALIRSLAVEAAFRDRGYATALAATAEAAAAAQGVEAIYLLTTKAATFFARRDYETIERNSAPEDIRSSEQFRSLCPDSAVCMVRRLSH